MSKFILVSKKLDFEVSFQKLSINKYNLYYSGSLYDYRDASGFGYIVLGDCIYPEKLNNSSFDQIEKEPKGNYYIIYVNNVKISVRTSGFGMLPVFYHQKEKIVTSNAKFIADLSKTQQNFDKKWLVNQLLFNYQFGDATVYKDIKLLPAFTVLTLEKDSIQFDKPLNIYDYFGQKPLKWQEQLKPLSKRFIEICEQYFPDEEFTISFTGGFDGRTLVSIAKSLEKNFKTFSYGRKNNDDVVIPQKNAVTLGIQYNWIPLEQGYIEEYFKQSALDFINLTGGANGFLYAHVNYSAKVLNKHTNYMISGVAGSELFRALHISGAVTSPALIQLFKSNSFEEFRKHVSNSPVFKYLNFKAYESVIDEVAAECWHYKNKLPTHLTRNQQLYVFVFEEIFRKFFGSWLVAQSDNLIVRTPFLDFDFFRELLKTDLAGVYSEFMTENPLKRFKGQVFYSEVIRRTSQKLFWQKTGKGYPPAFVRYASLRPLLFIPFLLKRFKRNIKKPNLDNLAIISGIHYSLKKKDYLLQSDFSFIEKEKVFKDLAELSANTPEQKRDNLTMYYSCLLYFNEL